MNASKFLKLALVLVIILLFLNIGSMLLFSPSNANAKGKTQYKVVSTKPVNSMSEYEKLLNQMGGDGWELDHVIVMADWAIFKK